jgi:hypothetical protein
MSKLTKGRGSRCRILRIPSLVPTQSSVPFTRYILARPPHCPAIGELSVPAASVIPWGCLKSICVRPERKQTSRWQPATRAGVGPSGTEQPPSAYRPGRVVFRDEDIAEKLVLHTSGALDDLIGAFIDSIMGPLVSAILLGMILVVPRKKLYLRQNNV